MLSTIGLSQRNLPNSVITTENGMTIRSTKIVGCYELTPPVFQDQRGCFVKTFHADIFRQSHLETRFTEEYYSVSKRHVLRGLHFQTPPADPIKIVYCVTGQILDVIVDLRVGSSTYGQFELFDLSAEKANMIYMVPGLAHGFYVLSENATVVYKASKVYSRDHDIGIHWDSVGIPWQCTDPIVSQRDADLPTFADFRSPFIYNPFLTA
jgi:dTDP-4-dehydrorhamnose 3,5-epimerase